MAAKVPIFNNKVGVSPMKVTSASAAQPSGKKTIVMAQERDEASVHTASINDDDEIDYHDSDSEGGEDSDDEKPDIKDKTFEFTNSNDIMRLIRMFFFIQVIAIALDNPTVIMPPLFRIAVNGMCFYSLRFFSRPFLDLVYAVEYYYGLIVKYAYLYFPSKNDAGGFSVVIGWDIPYIDRILRADIGNTAGANGAGVNVASGVARALAESHSAVDVIDPRIWHSLKFFSQFWMAILFTVMAVLFTIRMWEIKDYTDSKEVQVWLHTYVADGWIRRGGLRLARSITIGCACLCAYLLFVLGVSNVFYFLPSMPTYVMASTTFSIFLSVLVIIWFLGYRGFKATEAAFVRYVSQNVNYTSTIILKRAVKTKTEIALLLMFILYMPALYTFLQSIIAIFDWNDTVVAAHRLGVNYYVPCYFMAFPPFRNTHKPAEECPVASSVNQDWYANEFSHYGFYQDQRMVQCDSYFGIVMYVTGMLCSVFLVTFYGWMFYSLIDTVILEFQSSRWVEPYQILFSKTYVENMRFEEAFSWIEVRRMSVYRELHYQSHQWALAYAFFILQAKDFTKGCIQLAMFPLVCVLAPFAFFGKRIALLLCNCWTVEGRTRAALDERARIRTLHARRKKLERDGFFKPNTPYADRVAMTSSKLGMRNPMASNSLSSRLGLNTPMSPALTAFAGSMKAMFSTKGSFSAAESFRPDSTGRDFTEFRLDTPSGSRPGTAMGMGSEGMERDLQTPVTPSMSSRLMSPVSTMGGMFATLSSKIRSPFSMSVKNTMSEKEEEEAMFRRNITQVADTTTYIIEQGDTFEDEMEYIEKELPPITPALDIIIRNFFWLLKCCGGWGLLMKCMNHLGEMMWRWLLKSWIVSYTRMKFHFLLEYFRGNASDTLVGLGSDKKLHGAWRKQLQFEARERTVHLLRHRLEIELKKARTEFITDHQLVISIFDYVIDSSGIFMLISQYKWDRQWFSIMIWVEMTGYAMFAAPANLLLIWQTKLQIIAAVNVLMIMFNYLVQPYAISGDRWLDYLGRILIIGVCCGFLLEAIIMPDSISESDMPADQYAPWVSYSYIIKLNPLKAGLYLLVDGCMVICTYFYIMGVLNYLRLFAALKHHVEMILYTFHDHILDFMVRKLDERTIGPENVYSGLSVVQQWDDIIRHQRRYALLPIPDVRPSNLLPWHQKFLQVKWASLFNLTVANTRSSLGLTLLHTAMCSADGEVCRWLIHFYPELLTVEDSQRDTPIGIALKECAYNLLRYSKMNNGRLDDGTSFEDEYFFQYYDEIETTREDIRVNGEFLVEFADQYILDSKEAIQLHKMGYFDETPEEVEVDQAKKAREERMNMTEKQKRMAMIRGGSGTGGGSVGKIGSTSSVVSGGSSAMAKMMEEMNKPKFKFGLQPRKVVEKVKDATVLAGGILKKVKTIRFPEDAVNNNFESGQMGCWGVLGLTVPDINLFLDRTLTANKFYDIEAGLDKDIRYVIETCNLEPPKVKRFRANISGIVARSIKNEQVPYEHPAMRMMKDWGSDVMIPKTFYERMQQRYKNVMRTCRKAKQALGCRPRSGFAANSRGMRTSERFVDRDPDNKDSDSDQGSEEEDSSGDEDMQHENSTWNSNGMDYGLGSAREKISHAAKRKARKERQYKWKICKFAEILLSSEVLEKCEHLHWDLAAYKALSKLSSQLQGRIAHSLALVFNLNPPVGFARFSDWSCGVPAGEFEDGFHEGKQEQNVVVAGVLKVGETVEKVHGTVKNLASYIKNLARGKGGYAGGSDSVFNDRIVQYLAECYVCSRERCVLTDCELSGPGRIAYRAICRAMRLHNSTFVLPSVFVGAKITCVRYLELQKNELDCGDIIVLSEAVAAQQELMYLDISFNRIGCRGMKALTKVLKTHKSITTLRADHNRIGPAIGLDFGLFLKNTKTLKVLSLAHNRMGPMIRYTSPSVKEKIPGAIRDIMTGFKNNKGLQYLDLSYNHFGPEHVEYIVVALNKHVDINHIDLSGNDIGPDKGPALLFCLAGQPGGDSQIRRRELLIEKMKEIELKKQEDINAGKPDSGMSKAAALGIKEVKKKDRKKKKKKETSEVVEDSQTLAGGDDGDDVSNRPSCLAHIGLAENQLGVLAAHGVAALLKRNKSMTSLDISGNAFGPCGGLIITEAFERVLNITSRDEIKRALDEMQKQIMQGRNQVTKKLIYSNLTALNLSRNGLGPSVCASLMYCLAAPNCTIVSLDISNNPMGFSIPNAGDATLAAADCRSALGNNMSLTHLNFSKTLFQPTQLVSIFGGLAMNRYLREIHLGDMILDEPDCLQLSHAIDICHHLHIIDIPNSQMGPKGAKLILHQIDLHKRRIRYVDMSNGNIGLLGVIPLAKILADHHCAIKVLKIQNNMLLDEGGEYVAKALQSNHVLTELDISSNNLGRSSGLAFGDLGRGIHKDGRKICQSPLKIVDFSNNPSIGYQAARFLADGFVISDVEHINLSNIGAGPAMGSVLAEAFRHATMTWRWVDISKNFLTRVGMNEICWSMRQNRVIRVLKMGDNDVGLRFVTQDDALGVHGIALPRVIRENVTLRELDLSHLGLCSEAGNLIFEAMTDNYTIRKFTIRNNFLDDDCSYALSEMLRYNDIIEELDIGDNQFSYNACFVLAECLETNHSLHKLVVDKNRLGSAGSATVEAFCFALNMNCRLRILVLDNNRLGPEWGNLLADSLCRNNTLVRISLLDNRLDIRAGGALYRAYTHNAYLLELGVSSDEVGDILFAKFQELQRKKRAILTIDDIKKETMVEHELSLMLYDYY